MTYIPTLEEVQIGIEGTFANGATGSVVALGIDECRFDPRVEAMLLTDKRGDTMPGHDAYIQKRWAEGHLAGILNYQQGYLWLDALFGYIAPTGSSNVRTYLGTLDWAETEKSLCIYHGQTGGIFNVAGALPSELVISGGSGEPVRFSFPFFGQPVVDGAGFSNLADPSVVYVMGAHCALYLDDGISENPGTTPIPDIGFRFEFKMTSNKKPVWHLGDTAPDSWRNGKWGGSMKLVIEADATTLGYLGDILDATTSPRGYAVMVRCTDGTRILDLKGTGYAITPPTLITDDDGVVTIELEIEPAFGTHAAFPSCWGAVLTLP